MDNENNDENLDDFENQSILDENEASDEKEKFTIDIPDLEEEKLELDLSEDQESNQNRSSISDRTTSNQEPPKNNKSNSNKSNESSRSPNEQKSPRNQTNNSTSTSIELEPSRVGNVIIFFSNIKRAILHFFYGLFQQRKCPYCLATVIDRASRKVGNSTIKICENCNTDLPADFFKYKSKVIALVGGPETAKTTFITVLAKQLQSNTAISRMLKLHASIVDRRARIYHQTNVNRLFEKQEPLGYTSRVSEEDSDERFPIVIKLKQTKGSTNRSMYLSLFDAPGEDFLDKDILTEKYPHIGNADAMIYLIDPLNIKKIRNDLKEYAQRNPKNKLYLNLGEITYGEDQIDYEIIENLHEVFKRAGKTNRNGKLKIPTTFCLSKADLLLPITSIYMPEDLDYELMELKDIIEEISYTSEGMQEFIDDMHPSLSHNIEGLFNIFHYFPVSPLGKNPGYNQIEGGPEPKGILYPLLWILHELKFIKI